MSISQLASKKLLAPIEAAVYNTSFSIWLLTYSFVQLWNLVVGVVLSFFLYLSFYCPCGVYSVFFCNFALVLVILWLPCTFTFEVIFDIFFMGYKP